MKLERIAKQYDNQQVLITVFLNSNSFLDLVKVYIALKRIRGEKIPFHLKVLAVWLPYAMVTDAIILIGLVIVLFNL